MNCQDIEKLLDSGASFESLEMQHLEVGQHLSGCESCSDEWRATQALHAARELRTPPARAGLFAATMRRVTQPAAEPVRRKAFWLGAGVGSAVAAGVVIVVMSLNYSVQGDAVGEVPALAMALYQPRDVSVAINSRQALTGAQIRVVLTGGVRLAGFDDQSVVSWKTDLDRGVNRLTLPVVAVKAGSGQLLVEVEHSRKRQIFLVNFGVTADAAGELPIVGNRPDLVKFEEPILRSDV